MNIEKLEYLVEVAKTGSFSIASQNLFVSQSAISQSIVNLEKKLDVKLFERSRGNSAIPTDEGLQIISIANEMFMKFQELLDKANSFSESKTGKLKISTVPGFTSLLLKPIPTFKESFPNITIEIFQKPGNDTVLDIIENRVDIGIVPKQIVEHDDRIIYKKLVDLKMKLLVSANSHLAQLNSVTPQQILSESLILYNGQYINEFKDQFFKDFGIMNVIFATTNIDTLKNGVADNLSVSFVPFFHKSTYHFDDSVKLIDICDYDGLNNEYVWITSSKKHTSSNKKEYIRLLKNELKN
ncbi:LysR family transcriptional regulator [Gottfriedia sp. NPDC057991]|uniref:LysR family transcriptional regulator n=1 Tax=Gottfriedia sp. NPDC057991 TaxID=3346298 RepID=UPI0036D887DD